MPDVTSPCDIPGSNSPTRHSACFWNEGCLWLFVHHYCYFSSPRVYHL
jgi:hypothetical protein